MVEFKEYTHGDTSTIFLQSYLAFYYFYSLLIKKENKLVKFTWWSLPGIKVDRRENKCGANAKILLGLHVLRLPITVDTGPEEWTLCDQRKSTGDLHLDR